MVVCVHIYRASSRPPTTEMKRSASTNLVSSISFELFVIGVLNKYGDVTDVRGDGGVVVHHGDGSLLGAHLQESLGRSETQSNSYSRADVSFSLPCASLRGPHLQGNLSLSPGSFPLKSGYW